MCFLSSYKHLKFELNRVQINMHIYGKWLILLYFFEKRSEIVNRFFVNHYIAWGHLISWYKQMYDVLLSTAGNYYSEFNKFTAYFGSKSVVVCDLKLDIFLIFYNSRIIRIKVLVSRIVTSIPLT